MLQQLRTVRGGEGKRERKNGKRKIIKKRGEKKDIESREEKEGKHGRRREKSLRQGQGSSAETAEVSHECESSPLS